MSSPTCSAAVLTAVDAWSTKDGREQDLTRALSSRPVELLLTVPAQMEDALQAQHLLTEGIEFIEVSHVA